MYYYISYDRSTCTICLLSFKWLVVVLIYEPRWLANDLGTTLVIFLACAGHREVTFVRLSLSPSCCSFSCIDWYVCPFPSFFSSLKAQIAKEPPTSSALSSKPPLARPSPLISSETAITFYTYSNLYGCSWAKSINIWEHGEALWEWNSDYH